MNFFKEASEAPLTQTKKAVTFERFVHVVLIPCIREYQEAKLSLSIWYSEEELGQLKSDVLSDIFRFIQEQADRGIVISQSDVIRAFKDSPGSSSDHIESLPGPSLVRGTSVLGTKP